MSTKWQHERRQNETMSNKSNMLKQLSHAITKLMQDQRYKQDYEEWKKERKKHESGKIRN